jgi:hypothetical protein
MTTLTLFLAVIQAALLFWAALHFGNVFLAEHKPGQAVRGLLIFALPFGIAWFARDSDPTRALCSPADCLALTLIAGFVRYWAGTRENERLVAEREVVLRRAEERAEALRRAQDEERVRAATAALEAKKAAGATRAPWSKPAGK